MGKRKLVLLSVICLIGAAVFDSASVVDAKGMAKGRGVINANNRWVRQGP